MESKANIRTLVDSGRNNFSKKVTKTDRCSQIYVFKFHIQYHLVLVPFRKLKKGSSFLTCIYLEYI